jgi:hypothetical protein
MAAAQNFSLTEFADSQSANSILCWQPLSVPELQFVTQHLHLHLQRGDERVWGYIAQTYICA